MNIEAGFAAADFVLHHIGVAFWIGGWGVDRVSQQNRQLDSTAWRRGYKVSNLHQKVHACGLHRQWIQVEPPYLVKYGINGCACVKPTFDCLRPLAPDNLHQE